MDKSGQLTNHNWQRCQYGEVLQRWSLGVDCMFLPIAAAWVKDATSEEGIVIRDTIGKAKKLVSFYPFR